MKAVYALYPDGASAQRAVDGLRAAGVADRDITILSSQPIEGYEFAERELGIPIGPLVPAVAVR